MTRGDAKGGKITRAAEAKPTAAAPSGKGSASPRKPRLVRLDGHKYFHITRLLRNSCEITAATRLPKMGRKAPKCYAALGRTLALLDQIACCAWGCPGDFDAHVPQRLVGRGVSNANAAMTLAFAGQYDESLALARGVGELANLLWLFKNDSASMSTWLSLDDRARWNAFRPAEVRRKLMRLDAGVLVNEGEYSLLSEFGVHVTPSTAPQTLAAQRRPTLGGYYREDGFLVCLNEVAWAVGVLSLPTVHLLGPTKEARLVLKSAANLLGNVGGIRVTRLEDFWKNQKPDPRENGG